MFRKNLLLVLLIITCLFTVNLAGKEYIFPVHNFLESFYGQSPKDSNLIVKDGYIYGTCQTGGKHYGGVIYKVRTDGSDYTVLHHFIGDDNTDMYFGAPRGKLMLDGNRLYGITEMFDDHFGGGVWAINTDGTDFKKLADFYSKDKTYAIGENPSYGGVILVNGVLYGTTTMGGNGSGVIFAVRPDGTGFRLVHNFAADAANGKKCHSGVIYINGKLYGACPNGGLYDGGTLFSINTDGSDFTVHYHFKSDGSEGTGNYNPILYSGGRIYIARHYDGGGIGDGKLVSLKPDGSDFKIVHDFDGTNGSRPGLYSSLLPIGDYICGTTQYGGEYNRGVLYRVKKDGTSFEVLDHFKPNASLAFKGGLTYQAPYIYGTVQDGASTHKGYVYRYNIGYISGAETYQPDSRLTCAKLWGNAHEKGGDAILEKGFCYGTETEPDMEANVKVVGKGPGKFVADIYSLNPGRTYYVRAYVKTAMGTFYGDTVSFRSPHPMVTGKVLMDGKPVSGVTVDFVGRETVVTGADGSFAREVYYGWTGTIKLTKEGFRFAPATSSHSNVKDDLTVSFTCEKENSSASGDKKDDKPKKIIIYNKYKKEVERE